MMWNNVVVPEWGMVFMLSPKAANSTVKASLATALGRSAEPDQLHQGWEYVSPAEAAALDARWVKVAVVRNPFARAVSCWWQKLHCGGYSRLIRQGFVKGMPFRDFLLRASEIDDDEADHHFRSQYIGLVDDSRYLPDLTLRVEYLDREWQALQQAYPVLPGLETRNASNHGPWREYYNDETRAMAADRWSADLEILKYDFA